MDVFDEQFEYLFINIFEIWVNNVLESDSVGFSTDD